MKNKEVLSWLDPSNREQIFKDGIYFTPEAKAEYATKKFKKDLNNYKFGKTEDKALNEYFRDAFKKNKKTSETVVNIENVDTLNITICL